MVLEFLRGKFSLQLLMFLIIAFFCWIVFQIIGMAILINFADFSMSHLAEISDSNFLRQNKHGYFILFTIFATQSIGLFIVPSFIFAKLIKEDNKPFLSFSGKNISSFIWLLPLYVIAGIVVVSFMGELNMKLDLPEYFHDMEDQANETINYLLSFKSTPHLIATSILMAVIPAIGEELFFRGIIQKTLVQWTKSNWQAILITAFIFSAIHFQFLTFLPRFFMGIMLGYLLVWSRSLWVPIMAHFLHNFISIVVAIKAPDNALENMEGNDIWLVTGCSLVVVLISYWYYSLYNRNYVPKN